MSVIMLRSHFFFSFRVGPYSEGRQKKVKMMPFTLYTFVHEDVKLNTIVVSIRPYLPWNV